MRLSTTVAATVACLILVPISAQAQVPRLTAIDLYGITGHTQPIGIHHGYHIEMVKADSPAALDKLRPHDVIVKVDGEDIRGIDHLRAVMAEATLGDGELTITYTRGIGLEHHTLNAHLKPEVDRPVARRRRTTSSSDDR